jgi:transcriptional regulator with XRE-family HTH domain
MKNIELIALGRNIRNARRSLELSQEELAEKCDLHRTYVCDMENGSRNVSFMTLLKVASGLGTTLSTLTENLEWKKENAMLRELIDNPKLRVSEARL